MIAALIVVAAGAGSRLAVGCRKALAPLAGSPLVEHTLRRLLRDADLAPVVLVGHADDRPELQRILSRLERPVILVDGGERRQDSVARGLEALDGGPDVVLVHDAARPFVPMATLPGLIEQARLKGCAILALPVADTLKEEDPSRPGRVLRTLDRSRLWAAQTPQACRRLELQRRLASAPGTVTDEASLFQDEGVALVAGSRENFKITTMDDLRLAERIIQQGGRA